MPSVPRVAPPPQPWPPVSPPEEPASQKATASGFFKSLFALFLLFAFVFWLAQHFARQAAAPVGAAVFPAHVQQQSAPSVPVEITYDMSDEYLAASKQAIAILLKQCPDIRYNLDRARTAKASMQSSMPWMPAQHDYGWHYYLSLAIDPADMSPRAGMDFVMILLGAGRHPGFVPWVGMPARMCNHPIHQLVPVPALSVLKAYDAEDKVQAKIDKNPCLTGYVPPNGEPQPLPKGCPGTR